jgi:adenylate cyclase
MGLHPAAPSTLVERRRVLVVMDLAAFTRAVAALEAMELAQLVHDFYDVAGREVEATGGVVVKFVGDGCLALFDDEDVPAALRCVEAVAEELPALGRRHGVELELGANVHRSVVVEGEFGSGASRAHDVIGPAVIHAYRMGSGPGVRISEPVYRRLPNDQRGPWRKRQPPATYARRP